MAEVLVSASRSQASRRREAASSAASWARDWSAPGAAAARASKNAAPYATLTRAEYMDIAFVKRATLRADRARTSSAISGQLPQRDSRRDWVAGVCVTSSTRARGGEGRSGSGVSARRAAGTGACPSGAAESAASLAIVGVGGLGGEGTAAARADEGEAVHEAGGKEDMWGRDGW